MNPKCPEDIKWLTDLLDEKFSRVHEKLDAFNLELKEVKQETAQNSKYRIQSAAVLSGILLLGSPVFITWMKNIILGAE